MDEQTAGVLSGLDAATAALVASIKQDVKLAQTLGACGFAVCLWDTLAYLHIEYRVVWQAKWSPMKIAYLATRYITILTGILFFIGFFARFSPASCNSYVKVFPGMGTLPVLGSTCILIVRACNLWDKNRPLLVFMGFLAVIQQAGMIAVAIAQTLPVPLGHGIRACVPTSKGDLFIVYWILPAVIHSFITVFTFLKAWELASNATPVSTTAAKLWKVVFTQYGQIFPMCIVIVELIEVVFYLVANPNQRAICSTLSGFLISVLACQMVLILRLTSGARANAPAMHSGQGSGSTRSHSGGNVGKLGGVQAFVTSHQTVDDEKEYQRSNVHSMYTVHRHSGSHAGQTHVVVPALNRTSAAFQRADTESMHYKEATGTSDQESISEEEIKPVPVDQLQSKMSQ